MWRPTPGVHPSEFHSPKNETFVIFLKMFHCNDLSTPSFYLTLILHSLHMQMSVSEKVLISGKQCFSSLLYRNAWFTLKKNLSLFTYLYVSPNMYDLFF